MAVAIFGYLAIGLSATNIDKFAYMDKDMDGYQRDKDSSPNLSWSFLLLPWVVDEIHGLDQSEAASHTMKHELSFPPIPFPFAFDQWKNSLTDEEESSKRLADESFI